MGRDKVGDQRFCEITGEDINKSKELMRYLSEDVMVL